MSIMNYEDGARRKRQPASRRKVENDVNVANNNNGRDKGAEEPKKTAVSQTSDQEVASGNDRSKKSKKLKTQSRLLKNKKRYNNAVSHGTRYNNRHSSSSRTNQSPTWRPFTVPKTSTSTLSPESTTMLSPRRMLQKRVEKIRALKQRTQKLQARRQKNLLNKDGSRHPLRRNPQSPQRTKRETRNPFKKSSVEDITWI